MAQTTSESHLGGLEDADLPELFRSADRASREGQAAYLRSTAIQLSLLTIASGAVLFSFPLGDGDVDGAQLISVVAFIAAAIQRTYVLTTKPDTSWFEGRAAAESAKTLAWKFAVGGDPFPRSMDLLEGERAYRMSLAEVTEPLTHIPPIPGEEDIEQITDAMRALRKETLKARKQAYLEGRIKDQQAWYGARARWNAKRSRFWSFVSVAFEMLGAVTALFAALGYLEFDISSLSATIVAIAFGWMETKQHDALASAYAIAARELADIRSLIDEPNTEAEWASWVSDAEGAISREHTLWRSSRG